MYNIKTIYIKEMKSFFNSPMAYIFLGVFVLINGYFFTNTFFLINQSDLRSLFDIIRWVYIIFVWQIRIFICINRFNIRSLLSDVEANQTKTFNRYLAVTPKNKPLRVDFQHCWMTNPLIWVSPFGGIFKWVASKHP